MYIFIYIGSFRRIIGKAAEALNASRSIPRTDRLHSSLNVLVFSWGAELLLRLDSFLLHMCTQKLPKRSCLPVLQG